MRLDGRDARNKRIRFRFFPGPKRRPSRTGSRRTTFRVAAANQSGQGQLRTSVICTCTTKGIKRRAGDRDEKSPNR
jgi:hypothetical protein